jgi:hypothetical protein
MEEKLDHLVERKRRAVIEAMAESSDWHEVVADPNGGDDRSW